MKRVLFIFASVLFICNFQACSDSEDEHAVYEEKRKKIFKQCETIFSSVKITNFLEENHVTYDCRLAIFELKQADRVVDDLIQRLTRLLGFSPDIRENESGEGFNYLWTSEDIYVRITGGCLESQLFTEILILNPRGKNIKHPSWATQDQQ